jgi:thiol-disulfide isomerase/thioredoxin
MRTMRRCPRLRVPLLVLMSSLMVGACTGGTTKSPSPVVPTPAENATSAPLLPTTVNALPPTDVAGFHELLNQLKGTPVVVNVWGSWCDPCISEAPLLTAAALAHPYIQFVGVDILDSRDGALGFLTVHSVPYPSLFDPSAAIRIDLGAIGQPDTYFYDENGNQVDTVIGVLSQSTLDAGLAKIAPT